MPDLLLPVKAKGVITGASFGLRIVILEKLRLRDQDIIQTDDIKRLHTKQNDEKPHKKLGMLRIVHSELFQSQNLIQYILACFRLFLRAL